MTFKGWLWRVAVGIGCVSFAFAWIEQSWHWFPNQPAWLFTVALFGPLFIGIGFLAQALRPDDARWFPEKVRPASFDGVVAVVLIVVTVLAASFVVGRRSEMWGARIGMAGMGALIAFLAVARTRAVWDPMQLGEGSRLEGSVRVAQALLGLAWTYVALFEKP